jgi:methylated-DNA-[protein]-cysteine S-methyltransferase
MYCDYIQSDIGFWTINSSESSITKIGYSPQKPDFEPQRSPLTDQACTELENYFLGKSKKFDLPLLTSSFSPFYQSVWSEVAKVPYGHTLSYNDISKALNNPKAVRAVGMANGKNPFPILIPCHRVIGSDGSLTGYAFGLEVKTWLLELEGYLPKTLKLF